MNRKPPQLAYLCSQYPAVSHTFINREIEALRAMGCRILPFSMRPGQVLESGTDFEKQQLAETICIHRTPLWLIIGYQLSMFLRHPLGFLKGFWYAMAIQAGRPRESLWALFHLAQAAILARHMEKSGISHVHVHFGGSETAVALLAAKAFAITYSFTLHGPDIFYEVSLKVLPEKLKHAAFVICISHFAKGQAMRLSAPEHWRKLHIVRCGVDPGRFTPAQKPAKSEAAPLEILCLGRLTATKGQALLLQAYKILAEEGFGFRARFIGGGPDLDGLRQAAIALGVGERVEFTGPLGQEEVLKALSQSDLMILPSFAEGVPVVLMEAMAMEIPCISTRVGGIAELIEHETNGWLVHSGDVEGLTNRLRMLLVKPSGLAAIGAAARSTILAGYDLHANIKGLYRVFQEEIPTQ